MAFVHRESLAEQAPYATRNGLVFRSPLRIDETDAVFINGHIADFRREQFLLGPLLPGAMERLIFRNPIGVDEADAVIVEDELGGSTVRAGQCDGQKS